jgi:predicted ATPase with chaperone activity
VPSVKQGTARPFLFRGFGARARASDCRKKQADRKVQRGEENLLQRANGAETDPQALRDFRRGEKLLENAVTRLGLSEVARTIAKLDASLDIIAKHLSEAIQY